MGAPARRAWRDLRAHPIQVVGLALMVAVVTAISAGGPHTQRVMAESHAEWAETLRLADLEILFSPTHRDVAAAARPVPGVQAAEARLLLPAHVEGAALAGRMPALVRRLHPGPEADVDRLRVLEGRLPAPEERALVVDRSLSALHGLRPGATLTLLVGERRADLPVVGVVLSAEDALYPVHPEFEQPLRGALAILHATRGALAGLGAEADLTTLVNSLRVRLAHGVTAEGVQPALEAALEVTTVSVAARSEDPTQRLARHMIDIVGVSLPPMILVLFGLGAFVMATVMARVLRRSVTDVGTLYALGHERGRVAASFVVVAWIPTLAGLALGVLGEHAFVARMLSDGAAAMGSLPGRVGGPGPEFVVTALAWLVVATLSTWVPAALLGRASVGALLQRGTRLNASRLGGPVGRVVARWASRLRVPLPFRLAVAQMRRRLLPSVASVLCLGSVFAVQLAFVSTYFTFERGVAAAARRVGLDAIVRYERPVPEADVADVAARAEGTAEPLVTGLAWCRHGDTWTPLRAVGVGEGGWRDRLQVSHGRRSRPDAPEEVLLDRWMAVERGIAVGERVTLYRDRNAPEGIDAVVVGWANNATAVQVYLPLERARALLGLPGLVTGAQVTSPLPPDALEERLRGAPRVATARALGNAEAEALTQFGSGRTLNFAGLLAAVAIAGLFLAITTSLDNDEREAEVFVLHAFGWRRRSLAALCVGETLLRGGLAVVAAALASPGLASFFLGRLESVTHHAFEPYVLAWLPFALAGLTLLVLPAAAWPAFRAARDVSPARVLRRLTAG